MADIITDVAKAIRDARRNKDITQKELGERLGVSESAINRYEGGGQNLTLMTLQKIANALEIEIDIKIKPE